eukprot:5674897-Lingulodinium_polyedra.AAC.1
MSKRAPAKGPTPCLRGGRLESPAGRPLPRSPRRGCRQFPRRKPRPRDERWPRRCAGAPP